MIGRRLAVGVFVIWGVTTLMFVLIRVAPGDPATTLLGPDAT
ncbi:peptide ABC transporter permease, partial [Schumannella luteola]